MSKTTSNQSRRTKGEGTVQMVPRKSGDKWRARIPIDKETQMALGLKNREYWGSATVRKQDALPTAKRELKRDLRRLEELAASRLSDCVEAAINQWEGSQAVTTVDLKKTLRDKHLKGTALWSTPVAMISEQDIRAFASRVEGGKHTKRNVASLITSALKLIENKHLRHGQKFNYKPSFAILSSEEQQRLFAACESISEQIGIRLALRGALRRGELAGIRREHCRVVDGKPRAYLIEQAVTTREAHVIKDLKTEESEDWIPLDKETWELIKDRKGYLLTGTETHMLPRTAYEMIRRVVKRAGLEKKITTHTLRHNCAQTWLEAGIPVPQCARMMRHSIQVFLSTYVRPNEAGLDEIAQRIAG